MKPIRSTTVSCLGNRQCDLPPQKTDAVYCRNLEKLYGLLVTLEHLAARTMPYIFQALVPTAGEQEEDFVPTDCDPIFVTCFVVI